MLRKINCVLKSMLLNCGWRFWSSTLAACNSQKNSAPASATRPAATAPSGGDTSPSRLRSQPRRISQPAAMPPNSAVAL